MLIAKLGSQVTHLLFLVPRYLTFLIVTNAAGCWVHVSNSSAVLSYVSCKYQEIRKSIAAYELDLIPLDYRVAKQQIASIWRHIIPYPTAFPYGNGMVLHFYQQQESSMTKTVHKVINKGLKAYV